MVSVENHLIASEQAAVSTRCTYYTCPQLVFFYKRHHRNTEIWWNMGQNMSLYPFRQQRFCISLRKRSLASAVLWLQQW